MLVVVVRLYSSFSLSLLFFWFRGRTSFIVCMEEFIVEKNVRDDKGFQREEEKTMSSSSTRMKRAWDFWKKIGEPKYAVAPMVAQSERAYRLLTRRYGAQLCFTPMFRSRLFVEREAYQKQVFRDLEEFLTKTGTGSSFRSSWFATTRVCTGAVNGKVSAWAHFII